MKRFMVLLTIAFCLSTFTASAGVCPVGTSSIQRILLAGDVVANLFCYDSNGALYLPGSALFVSGVGQSSGVKHQRFGSTNTTAATAGVSANTSYNWTTPFADANYTVICMGGQPTGTPTGMLANGQTASGVLFQVTAITAVVSSYAFVDCIAFHD